MKKSILLLAATAAMAFAGAATAALVPGVYDPGATGCPVASYAAGVLHLAKPCPTGTNAAAGADITGLEGQPFTSATFTLADASQCQGGSPRFNIYTASDTFFLGCNNVTPVLNGDGTSTYLFDATTIADAGNQVPVPTGTITGAEVILDVEGEADLTDIAVNGIAQLPAPTNGGGPTSKADCKSGGWKTFTNPSFKNQGRCVSYYNHHRTSGKHKNSGKLGKHAGKLGKRGDDAMESGREAAKTTEHGNKQSSRSKGKHKD